MNNKGIALVEVIVGSAIIASSFVAIIGVFTALTKISYKALPRIQAAMIGEEAIEVMRSMRDAGYDARIGTLNSGTTYYLLWSSSTSAFITTTSPSLIDNTFTRKIVVAPAYRDNSYNLAPSGTADPDTKLVTITVSWFEREATSTRTYQTYVSNVFNN